MTATVSILGIGSYQGEDAVGWRAVRALQARRFAQRFPPGRVVLRCCAAPVLAVGELAGCAPARAAGADSRGTPRPGLAVFVDALSRRRAPGRVYRFTPGDLTGCGGLGSVHGIDLGAALALGRALDPDFPEVVVFGIGVVPGRGAGRDGLAAALAQLERRLTVEVDGFLRRPGGRGRGPGGQTGVAGKRALAKATR